MGRDPRPIKAPNVCQWVNLTHALKHFATSEDRTQSQQHIKPLHHYVACRLVLEGGFHPDNITPHPPFRVTRSASQILLHYDQTVASAAERTLLGGLKTKDVDVVVTKNGIGPVLAVSCKGAIGAFRNLTNRMEEAVGDCTNLHITYPAMVCGYYFVMRAHRAIGKIAADVESGARHLSPNDIAMTVDGQPIDAIVRFHSALRELTGRRGIRNDVSRYEVIALALIESSGGGLGSVLTDFPEPDSPLRIEHFFQTLYRSYDERYVYSAPELRTVTMRLEWAAASPILSEAQIKELGYRVRIGSDM